MKMDISLPSGEIKEVELEYEHLEKHCFSCFSLSHEVETYPTHRARVNSGDFRYPSLGISQSRTLDRLEANRVRMQNKKNIRSGPSYPTQDDQRTQRWDRAPDPSAFDWNKDRDFRINYGARRELSSREGSSRMEAKGPSNLSTPARERLSFHRDSSERLRGSVANVVVSQRQTWRPVADGTRKEHAASQGMSQTSHTPPPRPQREGTSQLRPTSNSNHQNSGIGVADLLKDVQLMRDYLCPPLESLFFMRAL